MGFRALGDLGPQALTTKSLKARSIAPSLVRLAGLGFM